MKRLLFGLGLGLLVLLAGTSIILSSSVYAQDYNKFTINSFDVDYYLAKDSDGRSTLKTVEHIKATFPAINQNHGLERAIPKKYDGHPTNLRVESITDERGQQLSYSDEESNSENLILRIGDADTFVHGEQTYAITYTQRDVTRFFSDTSADEFYWDVNGTGWPQSIDALSASVHIPHELAKKLTANASCYQGVEGSTAACQISRETVGDKVVFKLTADDIGAHETVTFAVGFSGNTFSAYEPSLWERIWSVAVKVWVILIAISSITSIAIIIWMSVHYKRLKNRAKGRSTIVPEYLPPKEASVLVSAHVLGNATSDITAQLIDFAVRHYIKIYQTKDKTMFKAAEYELEIVKSIEDLSKEEQRLLKDLFGNSGTKPGSRFNMATLRKKYALGAKLMAGRKAVEKSVRKEYALYERAGIEAKHFKRIGFIMLTIGIIIVSPLVVIASITAFIFASLSWPLTQKGAELRDYLKGLKEYITVAEMDRIKMLQSPDGAEKIGEKVDEKRSPHLVKLYERALPYAVLFGVEKEWTSQLGKYYETTAQQPDWYVGNGTFNAAVFTSSLSSFSSQSSMYSSSTSSSSGGSSGGGSSGGGGGGGGGGGW
jgi:uncharacterized membrane protein YgcG